MSRAVKALLIVAILTVLGVVVCGVAVFALSGGRPVDFVQTTLARIRLANRDDDLNRAVGTDDSPVRFTVEPGDSPRTIAAKLAAENLIIDANLFVDYVRARDLDTELEAGTYFLNRTQTIPVIAERLTDSRSSFIPFRILEGWRLEEIAESIDRNGLFAFTSEDFLRAVGPGAFQDAEFAALVGLPPNASLEGFLYPETYQLPPNVTPEMLRDTLLQQFLAEVSPDLVNEARAQDMTLYEAVTLASIVQREAVHADEQPLIASVYRNRMAQGMKLDADPTVQYGLAPRDGDWWPQITQADYVGALSPYNTYLNTGLPPGPIASPGITAIEAAIRPAESPYLYFRARCDGSGYHEFAVTYEEHVANAC